MQQWNTCSFDCKSSFHSCMQCARSKKKHVFFIKQGDYTNALPQQKKAKECTSMPKCMAWHHYITFELYRVPHLALFYMCIDLHTVIGIWSKRSGFGRSPLKSPKLTYRKRKSTMHSAIIYSSRWQIYLPAQHFFLKWGST